ncbi:MAG: hypothetical protein ABIJ85_02330 [bacterium]
MSNKEKEHWIGQLVTLDGKPARIVGRKLTYPHIVEIRGQGNVEFSWEAVKRIMEKGGHFKTSNPFTPAPGDGGSIKRIAFDIK